jgi:peptidoglycan/xylan/chitin deacetylase (PgdA/CDA1 family)
MNPGEAPVEPSTDSFIQSLMETDLYSIGAYFCDQHPELVDEVVERSEAIESHGLEGWARDTETPIDEGFRTLLTGLAVRYYKAVAG